MAWIKASDRLPPEDEPILLHDNRRSRTEVGRYVAGRWYAEDPRDNRLHEVNGVTHWAWILDSYLDDDDDD